MGEKKNNTLTAVRPARKATSRNVVLAQSSCDLHVFVRIICKKTIVTQDIYFQWLLGDN